MRHVRAQPALGRHEHEDAQQQEQADARGHARTLIGAWSQRYNEEHPHSALGWLSPNQYARQWHNTTNNNQQPSQHPVHKTRPGHSAIIKLVGHAPVCALLGAYMRAAELTSGAGEPKQVFFSFDATKAYGP